MRKRKTMSARGRFVTFEGGEGCGKTTQIHLLANRLEKMGRDVLVLREPGSTKVGEKIRDILLDPGSSNLDPYTELLLYEAARAQLVREVLQPALEAGKVVICDRFNDSTMAYQGYGRGLGRDVVRSADAIAVGNLEIDRTILLDRGMREALSSARGAEGGSDRIEREPDAFHERVHDAFWAIAAADPERVRRVLAVEGDIEATHEAVFAELEDLFA